MGYLLNGYSFHEIYSELAIATSASICSAPDLAYAAKLLNLQQLELLRTVHGAKELLLQSDVLWRSLQVACLDHSHIKNLHSKLPRSSRVEINQVLTRAFQRMKPWQIQLILLGIVVSPIADSRQGRISRFRAPILLGIRQGSR